MENLRITAVQTHLHWEDVKANLNLIEKQLKQIAEPTDLIILPEMFTTGFSMNANPMAEAMDGETMQWMHQQAQQYQAVVTGSIIVVEEGSFYNRLIWMRPDGSFEHYDKRHLFSLAQEHETYTAGQHKLIVEIKGWKVCPLVCYDLRFPVWSRNVENYDLLIYVANWPVTRSHHWKTLLMARAIENQCYTVGVNRVGEDEKGFQYSGDSSLYDYSGKLLFQVTDFGQLISTTLDYDALHRFREKLNFLPDQDAFEIS